MYIGINECAFFAASLVSLQTRSSHDENEVMSDGVLIDDVLN